MNDCLTEGPEKCWEITPAVMAGQETFLDHQSFLRALGQFFSLHFLQFTISLLGWGATDRTGEQSRYPRQQDLTLNATSDCNCSSRYFLETNVGLQGEDTCEGDSGQT